MSDRSTGLAPSKLTAVLGPTNTGKTHLAVERMLGHVARQRSRPSFGVCASCAHLRDDGRRRSDPGRYQCRLLNEPLAAEEINQICISFDPGKTAAVRSTKHTQ